MILAAAACAAAGISYILNDDEQSTQTKYETVTVSSTIVDKQGIIKYIIYPRLINQEQKGIVSCINEYKLNQLKLPIENSKQINNSIFKQELSMVFYWSIPLKARLLQTSTKPCLIIENLNPVKRNLMKISIGTQNGINENIPSEIALSNDDTLDSLSCNPMINDDIIPIGILKKKKSYLNERENEQKRFCFDKITDSNEENRMRNMILKNVNLCVDNLSKILSESCSNDEEQLTTLQDSSSIISAMNNNNNNQKLSTTEDTYENTGLQLYKFKHEEDLKSTQLHVHNENNEIDPIEQLSDGIILHRGKQFGIALGEAMIRKYSESYHSINELNKLLSKTNCLLMQQYKIESIEDLIRLFLEHGQHHFTELMINLFKVDPFIVEQLNRLLLKWARTLT